MFAEHSVATDYSSNSFIVRDPVISEEGGFSSSNNFSYYSNTAQTVIGEYSSNNYTYHSGFLYFPFVSSPVITATAGDSQVALSWTAASTALGFNVSSYSVGQAVQSGGPYVFAGMGNALATTMLGLANGTPYYFVVRVNDAINGVIATSTEVSATPVAAVIPPVIPPGGGGGGGGGGVPALSATVIFSGRAYPNQFVTLLKDSQVVVKTMAGPDSKFEITLEGLTGGNYLFTLYAEDKDGRRSDSVSIPVTLTAGATTRVSGIFLSPTIDVDKTQVKRGDNISIFGQTTPVATVVIAINSEHEEFVQTDSDKDGVYLYNYDTSPLELGGHSTKSKSKINNEISDFSRSVAFAVGEKNVPVVPGKKCPQKGDLNYDCKVNLVDFSIAAFWYKKTLSNEFAVIEKDRLNGDKKINLIDFSIMAYYWTG